MKREEREEFKRRVDSSKFGQHNQNTPEYHRQHPHQVIISTKDVLIVPFCLVFAIGFFTLLALTCFALKAM